MKKTLFGALLALFMLTNADASNQGEDKGMKENAKEKASFKAVPFEKAQHLQKGDGKLYCPICGMTLADHYKTNHSAVHNGKDLQYCSIHCMIEDEKVNGKSMTDHKAVDNETLKFKSSKDMFFVVGSDKPGTMSPISKYGFGSKEAAQKFAQENGGEVMNFEQTYALSQKRLQQDIDGTKKRQAKAAAMGEQILGKMCKPTDQRFTNPADAKTYLEQSKLCGNLSGKKLQAVALYLSGKGNK